MGVSGFYVVKDEGFDVIRKRPVFTSRLDINQYSEGRKGSDTLFSRYPFSRSHNDIHSGQSRESDRKRKRKARRKPQSYRCYGAGNLLAGLWGCDPFGAYLPGGGTGCGKHRGKFPGKAGSCGTGGENPPADSFFQYAAFCL